MKQLLSFFALCTFAAVSHGQLLLTNGYPLPPRTQLEALESRTNTVIVKGTEEMGAISCAAGSVLVICKETTDACTGQRAHGVAVVVRGRGGQDTSLLDYEELAPLLKAIDLLSAPQWSQTGLAQFDATYACKDGLKVGTFNNKAAGTVDGAIQSTHACQATASLSLAQLMSFRSLIDQAQAKLDSLRK